MFCRLFFITCCSEAIEGVARLLCSLNYKQRPDDPLVAQGRAWLDSVLNTWVLLYIPNRLMLTFGEHRFYSRGVLHALFKVTLNLCSNTCGNSREAQKTLHDDFFDVMRFVLEGVSKTVLVTSTNGSLSDVLLHDALSRALAGDLGPANVLFININKFIEIVHHTRYTVDLLQCTFFSISYASLSAQRRSDCSRRRHANFNSATSGRHYSRSCRFKPSSHALCYSHTA